MSYEDSVRDLGFTKRQRVDRAMHTLEGILQGIALDYVISPQEFKELKAWCKDNRSLIGKQPFTELIPMIEAALADGIIDQEEHADILWACQKCTSPGDYYNETTCDIQTLQGILHGVLADGELNDVEINELNTWLEERSHLKGCFPYDELEALLLDVLRDGVITENERQMLKAFFEDFMTYSLSHRIERASIDGGPTRRKLSGLCSVCPDLTFVERSYCFTGPSARAKRAEIAEIVAHLGGVFSDSVTSSVHYLVVGANGHPAWAYSCYGRKVEKAMSLRKGGHSLILVHEHDFWDAVQDHGYRIRR
jgi:hypothetical protein